MGMYFYHLTKMQLYLLYFLTTLCLCNAEAEGPAKTRNPKLFWVSTESSTSTVVTSSFCYMTATTLTACGKKRRRRFLDDNHFRHHNFLLHISPNSCEHRLHSKQFCNGLLWLCGEVGIIARLLWNIISLYNLINNVEIKKKINQVKFK